MAVRQQLGRRDHRKRGHSLELDVRMGATADTQHDIENGLCYASEHLLDLVNLARAIEGNRDGYVPG